MWKKPVLFKEFREFAFKGNLIDMAVGIIIGGAFGTVVKSLVDNIFMPPLGMISNGRINFSDRFIPLDGKWRETFGPHRETLAQARQAGIPVLAYGQFLTDLLSFVILAFAVFLISKKVIGAIKFHEAQGTAPTPLTADQKLLTEIRDLLKSSKAEQPNEAKVDP